MGLYEKQKKRSELYLGRGVVVGTLFGMLYGAHINLMGQNTEHLKGFYSLFSNPFVEEYWKGDVSSVVLGGLAGHLLGPYSGIVALIQNIIEETKEKKKCLGDIMKYLESLTERLN